MIKYLNKKLMLENKLEIEKLNSYLGKMNSILSANEILELSKFITNTCETILFRCGPFLKEGVYQDILVNELQNNSITTSREMVFPYQFRDSQGNPIFIGNSQSLRSDIELTTLGGILELKSSGSATKPENIFQLRNYLENRPDKSWGLLINFISKFSQNTGSKVTCTLLIKGDETQTLDIRNSQHQTVRINRYYRHELESLEYPFSSQLFMVLPNQNIREEDSMMNMGNEVPESYPNSHLANGGAVLNLDDDNSNV